MSKINVAVIGVGNCCSALVQGVHYYRTSSQRSSYGLMSERVGQYDAKDIEFVAAIDVNQKKVGRDLSEAIFLDPNNTPRFSTVPRIGVIVKKGPLLDGLGNHAKELIHVDSSKPSNISELLRESEAEILVNLLPTGAKRATQYYAEQALKAGCAFVNGTPSKLASDRNWQKRFKSARLQLVGDDIKNQVGSTVLHETILRMLSMRGVRIDESYQLDIGGGMESLNALDRDRSIIKRKVKIGTVSSAVPYKFPIVAGSSDYVEFMKNSRTSHFWIKGKYFGKSEFTLDMTLNVVEGPSCAAVLVDIIRATKIARDRNIAGTPLAICAYGFKQPPERLPFDEATRLFGEFSAGRRRKGS